MNLRRLLLLVLLSWLMASCGNGIDQAGNALERDSVEPAGVEAGDGDWVALHELSVEYSSNSIGQIRFQALDRDDMPFDGLMADAFSIYEDDVLLDPADTLAVLDAFQDLSGQLDTVLLLDVSASLQANQLERLRNAVRSALIDNEPERGMLPGQRIALYTFDSRVRRIVNFTDDRELLNRALDNTARSASPSSNLYGAVAEAVTATDPELGGDVMRAVSVVVITDGPDTANRLLLSEAIRLIGDKQVYTVGVGEGADASSLLRLGTAGSILVSDYEAVEGALLTVRARQLRRLGSYYELRYASPKRRALGERENSDHRAVLRVVENANTGLDSAISASFNSYDFSEVQPEVRIQGDRILNVGETAQFSARTDWADGVGSSYSWSVSGQGCSILAADVSSTQVLGLQRGACQLLAVDVSASVSASVALSVEQAVVEY